MYHTTTKDRLESIKQNGLLINQKKQFTIDYWVEDVYSMIPIFLSFEPGHFLDEDTNWIILEVNVDGLPLVADIGTMIDFGVQIDEEGFYFEEDSKGYLYGFKEDEYFYEDALNPSSRLCKDLISMTGTAACMKNISVDKIKIYKEKNNI